MTEFRKTADAIRSDAAALAAATATPPNWSTVRSRLLAAEIETLDKRPYGLSLIGERCGQLLGSESAGLQARSLFAATLQAAIEAKVSGYAELINAQQALSSGLLELWQSDRQALIKTLGVSWPAETLAAVLACGRRVISLAEQFGVSDVSEAAIAADWAQTELANTLDARWEVVKEGIETRTITTVAGAAAVLEA